MAIKKAQSFEATPGQIYQGISSLSEPFEGETKLTVEENPPFVIFCKSMYKRFPAFGTNAIFSEQHKEAINFLGWRLSPAEFMATLKGTAVLGFIPAILVIIIAYVFGVGIPLGEDVSTLNIFSIFAGMTSDLIMPLFLGICALALGAVGGIVYLIYSYPISAASTEKNLALTYVPEMVGYLIMSMKLVPNLEKAIEFSAKHGRGKVAIEFKRLIWDFQIGVYGSISEGLDVLAYRWGTYSTELKESLMKIRASVMEPSESKRYTLLDKTMLEVLESVKTKMEDYARGLNQPSVMLFYLGVLLPLLLIIILPIGSAFSGQGFSRPEILVLIYCVAIPAIAYTFASRVVKQRPPTYEPPNITDSFAELPKKWSMFLKGKNLDIRMVAIVFIIFGVALSLFLSVEGLPPKDLMPIDPETGSPVFQLLPPDKDIYAVLKSQGKDPNYFGTKVFNIYVIDQLDFTKGENSYYNQLLSEGQTTEDALNAVTKEYFKLTSTGTSDPTKYIFWSGVMLTLVFAGCFILYFRNIYKRKAQLGIIQMEDEFKESMYMIASRMGENKPVETALKQAREYLPNLLVSKRIFGKTVENIELMGMPLESAVFDPIYGAMKGIPSKTLTTAMRLLVDSVSLGVEVASRTLMSLSLQMENMDKVNKSLKDLVSDVTTTMQTMAIFIGPVVLGITVALQKVVMMTLAGVVSSSALEGGGADAGAIASGTNLNINSLFAVKSSAFATFATPLMFLIIIGIYVVEIVIIMIFFTTKVQEDNNLLFRINLAKSLPIAITIFVLTVLASNIFIGGLIK